MKTDWPSWPSACNEGYKEAKGDVLHFSADDLEAIPGWNHSALLHLSVHDELVNGRVFDYKADGHWNNYQDGEDGGLTWFTRVPIMTRLQYEKIGLWPHIDYFADVWVSEKARKLGIETRNVWGYDFIHHWHQHGRVDSPPIVQKAWQDFSRLKEEM